MKLTNLECKKDDFELLIASFEEMQVYFDVEVEHEILNNNGSPYLDLYRFDIHNVVTYDEQDKEVAHVFTDSEKEQIKKEWLRQLEDEIISEEENRSLDFDDIR